MPETIKNIRVTTHTEGPWVVENYLGMHTTHILVLGKGGEPGGGLVAQVGLEGPPFYPGTKAVANAHLIATAPNLLLYMLYVERNVRRVQSEYPALVHWCPLTFDEFCNSEEIENERTASLEATDG